MTWAWATQYIKEAAGYKAVLRDATRAFNEFAGSKLKTAPSILSISPRREFELSNVAVKAPQHLKENPTRDLFAPFGPHLFTQRMGKKSFPGVELRNRDWKTELGNDNVFAKGRDFSPLATAGHELAHAHQWGEALGYTGPTKALESMTPMPPGTLAYNTVTRPGVVARTFGRVAKFIPIPSQKIIPGVAHDAKAALRTLQISDPELQADRVSDAFRHHLKHTDPELYDRLASRIRKETVKLRLRDYRALSKSPRGTPEDLGAGAYVAATKDPEIRQKLEKRVRGDRHPSPESGIDKQKRELDLRAIQERP